MITKRKMQDYENIRQTGITNMFAINNVIALSPEGLTKEDCLDIMKHYNTYIKKFNISGR